MNPDNTTNETGLGAVQNKLPRWRGFNLLGMFLPPEDSSFPDMRPECNGAFNEEDFRIIADWGFDFVRLPLCYWHWSSAEDPSVIREEALAPIDRAVEWGQKHGLHVSINLHHAPGYCVNPLKTEAERFNLWSDPEALDAFCGHWACFAGRYRGISSDQLSFNLLNEPPREGVNGMSNERYHKVMTAAIVAVREKSKDRLIIADGLVFGTTPAEDLFSSGVAQSCRGYYPLGISHYKANWINPVIEEIPAWPGASHEEETGIGPERLRSYYAPWRAAIAKGVGVHCGEMGAWHKTPHDVFLAWLEDLLVILKEADIGWALWNFRGSFGILDSERVDVEYEPWHGCLLDRKLLNLLQRY